MTRFVYWLRWHLYGRRRVSARMAALGLPLDGMTVRGVLKMRERWDTRHGVDPRDAEDLTWSDLPRTGTEVLGRRPAGTRTDGDLWGVGSWR